MYHENITVLGESVKTITEEVLNKQTGKLEFQTVQVIERRLEREVGRVPVFSFKHPTHFFIGFCFGFFF